MGLGYHNRDEKEAYAEAVAWLKQEADKDRNRTLPPLRRGVRDEFGNDVTDEAAKVTEKQGKAAAIRHAREYLAQYERPKGLTDEQVIKQIMHETRTGRWTNETDRHSAAIWQEAMDDENK